MLNRDFLTSVKSLKLLSTKQLTPEPQNFYGHYLKLILTAEISWLTKVNKQNIQMS